MPLLTTVTLQIFTEAITAVSKSLGSDKNWKIQKCYQSTPLNMNDKSACLGAV